MYIVEEYLCNGNLKSVLECSRQPKNCIHENIHHKFIKLNQKKLLQMAQQIADGMDFIATSKVRYWFIVDLKNENRQKRINYLLNQS